MRQPIVVSTRKQTGKFMKKRIILATVLLVLVAALSHLFPSTAGDFFETIINGFVIVMAIVLYTAVFIFYYKLRTKPNFAVIIDEQGFHAGKLFVPWDQIVAISPVTVGPTRVQYVGIYPRDFRLILRQSSMNSFLKTFYGWAAAYAATRGIPPMGIAPDTMSVQELLQRIWEQYYPYYRYYRICSYPPSWYQG